MSQLVLVIDDDENIKESLIDVLRAEDFRVLTARDGEQALSILRELRENPRLILMDLVMPNMDGGTFLRKKADILGLSEIPVLVLTASKASVEGPDVIGHLRKPFDIADLTPYLQPGSA